MTPSVEGGAHLPSFLQQTHTWQAWHHQLREGLTYWEEPVSCNKLTPGRHDTISWGRGSLTQFPATNSHLAGMTPSVEGGAHLLGGTSFLQQTYTWQAWHHQLREGLTYWEEQFPATNLHLAGMTPSVEGGAHLLGGTSFPATNSHLAGMSMEGHVYSTKWSCATPGGLGGTLAMGCPSLCMKPTSVWKPGGCPYPYMETPTSALNPGVPTSVWNTGVPHTSVWNPGVSLPLYETLPLYEALRHPYLCTKPWGTPTSVRSPEAPLPLYEAPRHPYLCTKPWGTSTSLWNLHGEPYLYKTRACHVVMSWNRPDWHAAYLKVILSLHSPPFLPIPAQRGP